MSACRSCGSTVEWAITAAFGRRMPLDLGEHDDGNAAVVGREAQGAPIVVVLGPDDLARVRELGVVELRRSHFQTCPEAEKWRR